jgi:hypothetical protein
MHELEELPFAVLGEGIGIRALLAAGDLAGARALLDAPAPGVGYDYGISITRNQYLNGIVTAAEGNPPEGRALVQEALHTQREDGWRPDITHSLEALAAMSIDEGETADGVRLAGAAQAQRELMGYALRWPSEDTDLQTALTTARIELSSGFSRAFDEGRNLDIETAVELATGPRP